MFLCACSTPRGGEIGPGYLLQAASGQLEIFNRARPIPEVLSDPRLEPRYRKALEAVPAIRQFAESMGLRATSNYTEFVDLKRDAAVWVVSGCEPLRFEALRWSFPVVGGFSYLGWFDRESAVAMRDRLRAAGFDSDVRGASAYSTLGWFRDPVLSTLLRGEDSSGFVETLLHESVHATVHLDSQSTLNESVAQFVAEKLTPLYLEKHRGPAARGEYEQSLRESARVEAAFGRAYRELDSLYRSSQADELKQSEKARILAALRLEVAWPEKRDLNNATLVQFATYESGSEAFEELWKACAGRAGPFLESLRLNESVLSGAGESGMEQAIRGIAAKGCARSASSGGRGRSVTQVD